MAKASLIAVVAVAFFGAAYAAEQKPYISKMMTPWGEKVTPENAWREYPRPQMMRGQWESLSGHWNYAIRPQEEGIPEKFDGKILVPYPAPSALSGVREWIAHTNVLWYSRTVMLHPKRGERTLFHLDGADFRTQVFVNGEEATDAPHQTAQLALTLDITQFLKDGENRIDIEVWDPMGSAARWVGNSTGKQSYNPAGCHYTGITGIWAPVWLETVPETYVRGYRVTPDFDSGRVLVEVDAVGDVKGAQCVVNVKDAGVVVASAKLKRWGVPVELRLPHPVKPWSPETPFLYDLDIALGKDSVRGYFGMRKFEVRKSDDGVLRFYLNNRLYYPIGTLDQGWWPDGLLTPPSDAAMAWDIDFLKRCGFNMMRKHIKVEPMRYYHLCDRMGVLVLQDMPSGRDDLNGRYGPYRDELKGMIDQLYNVPSIVMWIPYNEAWGQPGAAQTSWTLKWVKRYDPSRVVDGPSGWSDYEGGCLKPVNFKEPRRKTRHFPAGKRESAEVIDWHQYPHPGVLPANMHRATMCGEFGGLGLLVEGHVWNPDMRNWGYGGTGGGGIPKEEMQNKYLSLMDELCTLALFKGCAASVYTQTTDVEGEINGLATYDRKVEKFDAALLNAAHRRVKRAAEIAASKPVFTSILGTADSASSPMWAYTTEEPAPGWSAPGFDDSEWRRAQGGFGSKSILGACSNATLRTEWLTPKIFLRTRFDVAVKDFDFALLRIFHDEDAEVFLNGEKIAAMPGYSKDYVTTFLDPECMRRLLKPSGNVLAVKVLQRSGTQFIDVGISLVNGAGMSHGGVTWK